MAIAGIRRRTVQLAVAAGTVLAIAVAVVTFPQLRGAPDGPTVGAVGPADQTAPRSEGWMTDGVDVRTLDLDITVPVRLLAVRFNDPSLAVFDLDPGQVTLYPPRSHGLSRDAISGAHVASDGTVVVWQDGTVRAFTDGLAEPTFEHTPGDLINPPYTAPALRVLPTSDVQALWIVQIGTCCPDQIAGVAELVDLGTGQVRTTVELPPRTFPAAALGDSLLLNSDRLHQAGSVEDDRDAGWTTEPGSQRVLRVTEDGTVSEYTEGHALAVSGDTVLVRVCEPAPTSHDCHIGLLDTTTGQRHRLEPPSEGTLDIAAGPAVPGDFTAWDVVAPDGRILASLNVQGVVQQKPSSSQLVVIDPDTGEITEVARSDGPLPPAAWDRNGNHIVLADGADIIVLDPADGSTITLSDVVPDDHHIVGIG